MADQDQADPPQSRTVVRVCKALLIRRSSATSPSARLRDVEIDPDQNFFPGHVDVAESLFGHWEESCEWRHERAPRRPAGHSLRGSVGGAQGRCR